MKLFLLFLIASIIYGCATAGKMNYISVGMTKQEVLQVLGSPASTSAQGNAEYLNYRFSETSNQAGYGITIPYYVRIIDGKVESYGKTGDFDSTKTPTLRIERDDRIEFVEPAGRNENEAESSVKERLSKLDSLKYDGVINESEYKKMRERIISDWMKTSQD